MREMQWVKPELVAQVRFVEWTAEGRLRHAAFLGLRSDKSARGAARGARGHFVMSQFGQEQTSRARLEICRKRTLSEALLPISQAGHHHSGSFSFLRNAL
jgi:hypothetical protein